MNFSDYLAQLPEEKAQALEKLAELLRQQLPTGFTERFDGRMLHFEVPLSRYPQGYHAQPGQPLPFISLAAQKVIWPYITLGFMPMKSYSIGGQQPMPQAANTS